MFLVHTVLELHFPTVCSSVMAGKRKRDILAEPSSDDVEPLVAGEKTRGRPSKGRAKTEAVPAGGEASKKAARKRPSAKEAVGSAAAKEEVQDGFPNGFPDYYTILGVDSSASTEMIHEADPCHGCDNAMRRNCIRNFPLKLESFRMTIL